MIVANLVWKPRNDEVVKTYNQTKKCLSLEK